MGDQGAAMDAKVEGTEAESGGSHMTPAAKMESDNFYSALERNVSEAWTDVSSEGPSEAPFIKSPHKARGGGIIIRQKHNAMGGERVIRMTKRRGSRVVGFVTPETITRT